MRREFRIAAAGMLGMGLATPAAAATIDLNFTTGNILSTNDSDAVQSPTGASALVTLGFTDASNGVTLSVDVSNTTGDTNFGSGATEATFTGFGLDFVSGVNGVSDLVTTSTAIDTLLTDVFVGGISNGSGGAGNFSFALADNNNFVGGNANGGLTAGDSASATVLITTALSAADLKVAYMAALFDPTSGVNATVRFQQVNAGSGSDKLLFTPPAPIPLPAAAWMLLAGLAGLGALARGRGA